MDYITTERYAENVDARCSTEWHMDGVLGASFSDALSMFFAYGSALDSYKKKLFYDKPLSIEVQLLQMQKQAENPALKYGLGTVHPDGVDAPPDPTREVPIVLDKRQQMILHAILGIATEATELVEAFMDAMGDLQTHQRTIENLFDEVNLREEAGDVMWYVQLLLNAINSNLPECITINDNKLEKRYGPAFSSDRANNRDLDAEREELER